MRGLFGSADLTFIIDDKTERALKRARLRYAALDATPGKP